MNEYGFRKKVSLRQREVEERHKRGQGWRVGVLSLFPVPGLALAHSRALVNGS